MKHIIQKQIFDVQMRHEDKAPAIQDRVSEVFRRKLTHLIEQILDQFSNEHQLIRIDKLELDLGKISETYLEADLVQKIREQLPLALSEIIAKAEFSQETTQGVEITTTTHSNLQLLQFYLENGALPWWYKSEKDTIEEIFHELITQKPRATAHLLQKIAKQKNIQQRLIFQFSNLLLEKIIRLLIPKHALSVNTYLNKIQQQLQRQSKIGITQNALKHQLYTFTLNYIFESDTLFRINPFKLTLKEQLTQKLELTEQESQRLFEGLVEDTNTPKATENLQSQLEILRFFLKEGRLPEWSYIHSKDSLEDVLIQLLETAPQKLIRFLRLINSPHQISQRINHQFSKKTTTRLFNLLTQQEALFVNNYLDNLNKIYAFRSGEKPKMAENLQASIFSFFLQRKPQFTPTSFNQHISRQLLQKQQITKTEVSEIFDLVTQRSLSKQQTTTPTVPTPKTTEDKSKTSQKQPQTTTPANQNPNLLQSIEYFLEHGRMAFPNTDANTNTSPQNLSFNQLFAKLLHEKQTSLHALLQQTFTKEIRQKRLLQQLSQDLFLQTVEILTNETISHTIQQFQQTTEKLYQQNTEYFSSKAHFHYIQRATIFHYLLKTPSFSAQTKTFNTLDFIQQATQQITAEATKPSIELQETWQQVLKEKMIENRLKIKRKGELQEQTRNQENQQQSIENLKNQQELTKINNTQEETPRNPKNQDESPKDQKKPPEITTTNKNLQATTDNQDEPPKNHQKPQETIRNNKKPQETIRNPKKPQETPRNSKKQPETPRNPKKSQETTRNQNKPLETPRNNQKPKKTIRNLIETISYYLQNARLPDKIAADLEGLSIEQLFIKLLEKQARKVRPLLQKSAKTSQAQERLIQQLSEKTLLQLLQTLQPQYADYLQKITWTIRDLYQKESRIFKIPISPKILQWQFVFAYLISVESIDFQIEAFINAAIQELVILGDESAKQTLRNALNEIEVKTLSPKTPTQSEPPFAPSEKINTPNPIQSIAYFLEYQKLPPSPQSQIPKKPQTKEPTFEELVLQLLNKQTSKIPYLLQKMLENPKEQQVFVQHLSDSTLASLLEKITPDAIPLAEKIRTVLTKIEAYSPQYFASQKNAQKTLQWEIVTAYALQKDSPNFNQFAHQKITQWAAKSNTENREIEETTNAFIQKALQKQTPKNHTLAQAIAYFLRYNRLSPKVKPNFKDDSFDQLFTKLLQRPAIPLTSLLQQVAQTQTVQQRLIQHLSDKTLKKLLRKLQPNFEGFVGTVHLALQKLKQTQPQVFEASRSSKMETWQGTIAYLLKVSTGNFDTRDFVSLTLQKSASILKTRQIEFVEKMQEVVSQELTGKQLRFHPLQEILEDIRETVDGGRLTEEESTRITNVRKEEGGGLTADGGRLTEDGNTRIANVRKEEESTRITNVREVKEENQKPPINYEESQETIRNHEKLQETIRNNQKQEDENTRITNAFEEKKEDQETIRNDEKQSETKRNPKKNQETTRNHKKNLIETIAYFLQNARFPEQIESNLRGLSFEQLFEELLEKQTLKVFSLLQSVVRTAEKLERLILQLSEETLFKLLEILQPKYTEFIRVFQKLSTQIQAEQPQLFRQESQPKLWQWKFILTYLLTTKAEDFHPATFIARAIEQFLTNTQEAQKQFVNTLQNLILQSEQTANTQLISNNLRAFVRAKTPSLQGEKSKQTTRPQVLLQKEKVRVLNLVQSIAFFLLNEKLPPKVESNIEGLSFEKMVWRFIGEHPERVRFLLLKTIENIEEQHILIRHLSDATIAKLLEQVHPNATLLAEKLRRTLNKLQVQIPRFTASKEELRQLQWQILIAYSLQKTPIGFEQFVQQKMAFLKPLEVDESESASIEEMLQKLLQREASQPYESTQAIGFYLRYDRLPKRVTAEIEGQSFEDLFEGFMAQKPQQLMPFLQRFSTEKASKERLIEQLSNETLQKLVEKIEPNFAGFIATFRLLVQQLQEDETLVFESSKPAKVLQWEGTITYLLKEKRGRKGLEFDMTDFTVEALQMVLFSVKSDRQDFLAKLEGVVKRAIDEKQFRFFPFGEILEGIGERLVMDDGGLTGDGRRIGNVEEEGEDGVTVDDGGLTRKEEEQETTRNDKKPQETTRNREKKPQKTTRNHEKKPQETTRNHEKKLKEEEIIKSLSFFFEEEEQMEEGSRVSNFEELFVQFVREEPRKVLPFLRRKAAEKKKQVRLIRALSEETLKGLIEKWQPDFVGFVETVRLTIEKLQQEKPVVLKSEVGTEKGRGTAASAKLQQWEGVVSYFLKPSNNQFDTQTFTLHVLATFGGSIELGKKQFLEVLKEVVDREVNRKQFRFFPLKEILEGVTVEGFMVDGGRQTEEESARIANVGEEKGEDRVVEDDGDLVAEGGARIANAREEQEEGEEVEGDGRLTTENGTRIANAREEKEEMEGDRRLTTESGTRIANAREEKREDAMVEDDRSLTNVDSTRITNAREKESSENPEKQEETIRNPKKPQETNRNKKKPPETKRNQEKEWLLEDLLVYFLTYGLLPEPMPRKWRGKTFEGLLVELLSKSPKKTLPLLRKETQEAAAQERLVKQLSEKTLKEMLKVVAGNNAAFVERFMELLRQLYESEKGSFKVERFLFFQWRAVVKYFVEGEMSFDRLGFLSFVIRYWVERSNFSAKELLGEIQVLAADGGEDVIARVLEVSLQSLSKISDVVFSDRKTRIEEGADVENEKVIVDPLMEKELERIGLQINEKDVFDMREVLNYLYGHAEYLVKYSKVEFDQLFRDLMKGYPDTTKTTLLAMLDDEDILEKILTELSEKTYQSIVVLLQSSQAGKIEQYVKDMTVMFKKEVIRKELLLYLKGIDEYSFSLADFIHHILSLLVGNDKNEYARMLVTSIQYLKMTNLTSKNELRQALSELKIKQDVKVGEIKQKGRKRVTSLDEKAVTKKKLIDETIYVQNAGLVLIYPFLSRYFNFLGMLEKGKLKDEETAHRAVLLLQFLATGFSNAPEHELVLNKLLCGLPLDTPVPLSIDMTDKEKEISGQMLQGVIQNWKRLNNMTVDNFRGSFLLREGKLEEKEKAWQLKVEKKAWDILLKTLPWGFSIVRLPWMEKMINVEWQE